MIASSLLRIIPALKSRKTSSTPTYQRLGYILEYVLEREELADKLKAKTSSLPMRKIPFKIGKSTLDCEIEKKWKVIINQEIEVDE